MVILEGATTGYDPHNSIHEMLNGLELETKKTRKMVDEPWEAIFRRVSSVEEPRASSISSQRDNVQRVSPPQNHFMRNRESEVPPKDTNRHPVEQDNNFERRQPANPRVVKSNNWLNNHQEELYQYRPTYVPVTRPYTEPPIIQSARPRYLNAEPRLQFDFSPKPKLFSDPLPLFDHHRKSKKKYKKAHKSDGDVQEICRRLAESRETCYKGSMREVQFRLMDLDRHQQQSDRNSRNSL